MNIAYFSNQFADADGHGLARYSRELHAALLSHSKNITPTPVSAWSSMPGDILNAYKKASGLQILPWGRKLTPLFWTFLNAPTIEHGISIDIDLVHAVSLGYPIATRKPLVVTVHDLGPLTQPQYFQNTSPWIMRRSLAQVIDHAAQIICVSRSTADELLRVAGEKVRDRIQVIHEGVADSFFSQPVDSTLKGLNLPEQGTPYILSTGKISPRKNVEGVIMAIASLAEKIPHHLVLVGGDGWNVKDVYSLIEKTGIASRIHLTGYISDAQLGTLYRGASAYVHPSYYEGFGLTNLEAMASGCPVITSNVFSIPEVIGNSAIMVDPSDTQAIANSIEQVCTDAGLAEELRLNGRSRASLFRWSKCAEQVTEVYQMAAR